MGHLPREPMTHPLSPAVSWHLTPPLDARFTRRGEGPIACVGTRRSMRRPQHLTTGPGPTPRVTVGTRGAHAARKEDR
jgi:hypothetical protein